MAKWLDKYEQGGMVLKKKIKDNYGSTPNANAGYSTAGPGWVGEGTTDRGFNYNGAWGGTMQMGGSMPGSVGFMYARTQNPAPANGKYAKKTLASAQEGKKVDKYHDPKNKKLYGAPEEDKIKDWFVDYYSSPFFKENAYDKNNFGLNIDPEKLSQNTINTIKNVDTKYYGISDAGYQQMTYGDADASIYMGHPNIYGNQPKNEVYAHEIAHLGQDAILAAQPRNMIYMKNHNVSTDYGKKEADELFNTLTRTIPTDPLNNYKPKFKSVADYRNSELEDFARQEAYNAARSNHDNALPELRANIMALRYLASKKGIWDATKSKPGSFTADMLNKLYKTKELNTPVTRQSPYGGGTSTDPVEPENIKQGNLKNVAPPKTPGTFLPMLRKRYTDSDILYLMNKLAKNEGEVSMDQAQNGMEMKYYQDGLDFKPKSISKKGKKIIKDDMGQWAHPGEITEIGSPDITMQGVDYPVLGISDTGDTQMMYPDQDYKFDGEKVTEYPMMKKGGWLNKYK